MAKIFKFLIYSFLVYLSFFIVKFDKNYYLELNYLLDYKYLSIYFYISLFLFLIIIFKLSLKREKKLLKIAYFILIFKSFSFPAFSNFNSLYLLFVFETLSVIFTIFLILESKAKNNKDYILAILLSIIDSLFVIYSLVLFFAN